MNSSSIRLTIACRVLQSTLVFAKFSEWFEDPRLKQFVSSLVEEYLAAIKKAVVDNSNELLTPLMQKPKKIRFFLKKPKQLELLLECHVAPPPGAQRGQIGAVELMGDSNARVAENFVHAKMYLNLDTLIWDIPSWDAKREQKIRDQLTLYILHELIHLLDPKNRGELREHPSLDKYLSGPKEPKHTKEEAREYYYQDPREKDAYIGGQYFLQGQRLADAFELETYSTEELNEVIKDFWHELLTNPTHRRQLQLNKNTDYYLEIPSLRRKILRVFLDGVMSRIKERKK